MCFSECQIFWQNSVEHVRTDASEIFKFFLFLQPWKINNYVLLYVLVVYNNLTIKSTPKQTAH